MKPIGWRLMLNDPAPGAWNMAVDSTLMIHAKSARECVLRTYAWSRPTLSFGRNQTAAGQYDAGLLSDAGVDCVRRPTGGRAVLHFREITYAVAAPLEGLGTLKESYARINRLLQHALALIGVYAGSAEPADKPPAPGPAPCFDVPTRGELVLNGRKLVGSAQWRDEDALLQHGSILVRDDQTRIADFQVNPERSAVEPATLAAALGREPALGEVHDALRAAVVTLEDAEASPLGISDLPATELDLALERFADARWTWRR